MDVILETLLEEEGNDHYIIDYILANIDALDIVDIITALHKYGYTPVLSYNSNRYEFSAYDKKFNSFYYESSTEGLRPLITNVLTGIRG